MSYLLKSNLNKTEVRKHVGAIQINGKLSLLQRKLSNVLLWNAYDGLLKEEKHRIRIRDLAYLVGFDSNDIKVLKTALRGLVDIKLEWNMLHEDGDKEWGIASMLGSATIRGGYCSYTYDPNLREKFYNPEMYARINIGIQRNITTGYALTLYENCIRYRNVGSTGLIDLEMLRKLFGVGDKKYYRTFKFFNNKIIKPAIDGINEASDIVVNAEYKREKRRVVAVRFKIKDNPQTSLFEKARGRAENEDSLAELEAPVADNQDLVERLIAFGVAKKMAERFVQEHAREYLEEKLEIVEKDLQAGKVKSVPRYTVAAIEQDYQTGAPAYVIEREKEKAEKREREAEKLRRQQAKEKEEQEKESEKFKDVLKKLSPAQRSDLEARFHQEYSVNSTYQKFIAQGKDNAVIRGMFQVFARRELLGETPS